MTFEIRTVVPDDWEKARELRLAALRDPVAHLAFLEAYEDAAARPDDFWRERTAAASEAGAGRVRQFVAEAPDGRWLGSVTVLVERPADEVRFGEPAKVDQTHLVGVYVRPEARGTGVVDALFRAAVAWSWTVDGIRRVRLYVHEENARAAAFYRRFGFAPSGERVPVPDGTGAQEEEYELLPPGAVRHGGYVLRAIRSGEGERVRELRLAAVQDPDAALAFVESYEETAALPDAFWRQRAEGGSEDRGTRVRQFVAEAPAGRWVGTATVIVELPEDGTSLFGDAVTEPQVDVVGVYVRPEARGSGLVDALLRAALGWAWALPEPRIARARLYVHEENGRALAAYRRFGFVPTGGRADTLGSGAPRDLEHELRRPA